MKRRTFLRSAATLALGIQIVPRYVLGQGQTPPSAKLNIAGIGIGGQGGGVLNDMKGENIVALCDVDSAKAAGTFKAFPNAERFRDYRVMLEKRKDIEAVMIATPDHMHAPIGVSAMQLGKHLYGQKPLAHELYEVRRMTEIARHSGVVTQMGIQIHSDVHYRLAVQVIQDGTIGKIKEVHSWCNKTWGDTAVLPDRSDPVPANFNWDMWLGVCAARPYLGNSYYHPGNWRKRLDFGTGTLGDMACHILDPVYESLGLVAPIAVRSEGAPPNRTNWGLSARVIYTFAGTPRTAEDRIAVTWYDGANKPPGEVIALLEGQDFPGAGSIFVGSKGAMLLPHYDMPALFPAAQFKDFKFPKLTGFKHWEQFVEDCRGNDRTRAGFDYAGPLTEAVLLGGVAARFPQTTLGWESRKLKFDLAEANQHVRREYRSGWQVRGL